MQIRPRPSALILLLVFPVAAQQGAAIFHHFRQYPMGQYTTRTEGSITGLPPGAPITQTSCTVPPTPAQLASAINVANSAGSMQDCTVQILRDEEKIAEYEQTCHNGPTTQVIHHLMTSIDDRTFKTDTVSQKGTFEISQHSTVHYDGPCTAAQLAEASRATAAKPTSEECAEFADSEKEMAKASKSCADAPAESRATCLKSLQSASANLQLVLNACAK